jgi:hypothetical protein
MQQNMAENEDNDNDDFEEEPIIGALLISGVVLILYGLNNQQGSRNRL